MHDPNSALDSLADISIKLTGRPMDIKKFETRMKESGSLDDFVFLFLTQHRHIISTKLFELRLGNLVYSICVPFRENDNERVVVPAFITNTDKNDGWTRLGFYYSSQSQGMWRFLPWTLSKEWKWYDKGQHGEHSIYVPWEAQLAFDQVHMAMKERLKLKSLEFPKIDTALFTLHIKAAEEMQKTVMINLASTGIVLLPNGTASDADTAPVPIIAPEKKANVSDRDNVIASSAADWPVYGRLLRILIHSQDKRIRYLFCAADAGLFLGAYEKMGAALSNYGMPAEFVGDFPQGFLVPLYEYPQQVPPSAWGAWTDKRGDYVRIAEYHDKVLPGLFPDPKDYEMLKKRTAEFMHRIDNTHSTGPNKANARQTLKS